MKSSPREGPVKSKEQKLTNPGALSEHQRRAGIVDTPFFTQLWVSIFENAKRENRCFRTRLSKTKCHGNCQNASNDTSEVTDNQLMTTVTTLPGDHTSPNEATDKDSSPP